MEESNDDLIEENIVKKLETVEMIPNYKKSDNDNNNSITETTTVSRRKVFNLLSTILYLIGSIIGTGIFMTANSVTSAIPSIFYSILFWGICGIISLCIGLCYAELGLLLPSCGGEYIYFIRAYHDFFGFSFMFSNLIFIKPLTIAILILFTAETFCNIISTNTNLWIVRFVSIGIVILLCTVHCVSNYVSVKINDFLTYLKFIGMAIIIGIAIYKLSVDGPFNFNDWGFTINVTPGNISKAIYNCMWTYDGFNMLAYVVEEMVNPEKNIVIASVIALSFITLVYIILNFCYFAVLGVGGMAAAEDLAYSFAYPYLGKYTFILLIFIGLSSLGSGNSTAYSGARIYFDAARNNHVPSILSTVHIRFQTCIPSLVLQAILTIICLIVVPDIDQLLSYFSNAVWIYYTLALLSVVVLRYRMPVHRVFKVPLPMAIILTIISGSFYILGFFQNWVTSLISTAIVVSSLPIYMIFVYKESYFVKKNYTFLEPITLFLMKILHLELSTNSDTS